MKLFENLKAKLLIIVAAAVMLGATNVATAAKVKMIDVNAWGNGSAGGPFEVKPISGISPLNTGLHGAGVGNWLTFCVERNEFIAPGNTYDVVVNTAADAGGVSGGPLDPLDPRTAFLYTHFLAGDLNTLLSNRFGGSAINFDYQNTNGGSDESGSAAQDAVWKLEGEITTVFDNTSLTGQLITLADEAVNNGLWTGLGKVRIMNMTQNGVKRQDLLVMVPSPTAAWMGLTLLGGIVVARRKKC